jgi:hypothetical protein
MDEPRYAPLPPPSPLVLTRALFPNAPPAVVVRLVVWLRTRVARLAKALGPAELSLFEDATNAALLHVLAALVRTGVPEALAQGPLSAEQLAERTGLNADAVFRTLRCTTTLGYFRLRPDLRFEHNARSRVLAGGSLDRAREFLLYFASGSNLAAWGDFEHALRTGHSPFDHVHGRNVWQWFEHHADEREMFAHAMMGMSVADAPVIARLYPFSEVRSVCDVGGGRGTLLSELLLRHPHLRGILYDSDGVLQSARALLGARGVLERVELVAGDFFERVPSGADVYLLKNVLHDWNDATCISLLRTLRAATAPGARVLLAEALVERDSRDPLALPADLQMMVACSEGRERGGADFARLFDQSGFVLGRVFKYPTISLIEALPRAE